jgi:chromosome segregation ATPase
MEDFQRQQIERELQEQQTALENYDNALLLVEIARADILTKLDKYPQETEMLRNALQQYDQLIQNYQIRRAEAEERIVVLKWLLEE